MEQNKTTSQICNLGKILSNNKFNKIFIIPPYQRLYAWKDEQIKALLDDFKNCIEHNEKSENNNNIKTHFIGNLVVAKNEDDFELVDGQQRLSTIFFLCVYMCREDGKMQKATGDFANAYKFAFVNSEDKNSNNHKCRIHMPIREDDENAIWNYDFDKTNANIRLAFNCFDEYFKKANDCCDESLKKAELKSFCDFIFTNVNFNLVILGDQVELNKYFVRMNNTGVQLDGTDILKARLLKLISDNDKSQVTEYARIFDECSQMNYFADFSKNYENTSGKVPTIENIINNENNLQNYSNNDKDRAEFESIIDFPTFVLHVFKILSRQESTKKYFKSKISIKKDKFLENTWECINFDRFTCKACKSLIAKTIIDALKEYRTIFDTFVIKRKSDDDENVYKLWNKDSNDNWSEVKDIEKNKNDLKNLAIIQNYLRVARRGDNTNYHHFLTHYLEFCKNEIVEKQKEITNENCLDKLKDNADNLRKYLKNIDDFLAYKMIEDGSNLIYTLKDFENKPCEKQNINFDFLNYNNRGNYKINLTYWFHRLEYYLLIGNYYTNQELGADFKEKFEKYKSGYYFRNINSVEHILAQHEEDQTNNKIDKNVLHSFGNLALISSSENSSLSNQGYAKKKIDFEKKKIISLKLFDVFENNGKNQWLSEQIEKHQNAMLGVLKASFFNSQEQVKTN